MLSLKQPKKHVHAAVTVSKRKQFGFIEAIQIGAALSIGWESFDVEQFTMGLNVELEHGRRDPVTDVTHDDPLLTGMIALAHLNEIPDYYTRLAVMEKQAELGKSARRR